MTVLKASDSDDGNKWKAKYFALLDEYDVTQQRHQDEFQLLKKILTQLTSLTKGLDADLDPLLQGIQEPLKNGLDGPALISALNAFSNNIVKLTVSSNPDNTEAKLQQILNALFPEKTDAVNKLILSHATKPNTSDVVEALQDILSQSSHAIEDFSPDRIHIKQISTQLSKLLNSLEIPLQFQSRAQSLNEKLLATPSTENFFSLIEEYRNLLMDIKIHLQDEQKEMTSFLSSLSNQLAELGIKVSGASQIAEVTTKKRNLLDESLTVQMSTLQQSSAAATSLEPLKQLVNSSLINIRDQINTQVKIEAELRQQNAQQFQELTDKINKLDAESTALKSKLTVAYNRATKDTLTNLPNRLAFDEALEIETARWKRHQMPLTLVIWDIDLFKRINDTYGHKAGDKTLIIIANLLNKYSRKTDFIARFGGEEFIMLLPNTDIEAAQTFCNKIRLLIEGSGFNAGGERVSITISCGLSEFKADDNGETVFERADRALYQSKASGRNQCTVG